MYYFIQITDLTDERHVMDGQYLLNVMIHRCMLINDYSEFLIHVVEFQTTIALITIFYFTDQLHLTILPQFVEFMQHVYSPYFIRTMRACRIPQKYYFHLVLAIKELYLFLQLISRGYIRLWTKPNVSRHELSTAMQHLYNIQEEVRFYADYRIK